ncbi:MAG: UTP--glucose-1-phosphate uridylyltransferase [Clostridia bacterium]|jgi:UTP--glucose-1-phosphate uridylyltransferase|nr:UTP--glucose-1-phosphate uridylyltransferase [Clostridium sp.]MEE0127540.1 UTP--glucose-1-phosphate uridylyltransferase [Clostridia bacterium]
MKEENLIENLKIYGQTRTLKILENVDKETRKKIIEELHDINFIQLKELYNNIKEEAEVNVGELKPIKSLNPDKITKEEKEMYENVGADILRNNKFAVVTMSGGQGTRLGYKGPKGTFKIDVEPQAKYLFEIIVDTLQRANKKYNVTIPWYIMTSNENNDEIVKFMEEHNYFGYDKEYIGFFEQGELPLITEDGQILLDENYNIKKASDGNGSIFKSMYIKGVLEDMKTKGIEWVYIGSIDNVLLKMVDTLLMGVAIKEGSEIATRSIFKNCPTERIGSLCIQDGKVKVIEYSELPQDMIEAKDEDGEILFGESHVMCNLFSIKALEKISLQNLQYHKAHKKYSYLDENGKLVEPEEPNAYKFEYFIFDSFEFFNQISIVRGKREEDFAPVKNKEGVDSPATASKLYNEYWRKQNERM